MTGVIILAAGGSSRLGQPKQNLIFKGQTLLERAVNSAQQSGCGPVVVVLGANHDQINPMAGVTTLYNKAWDEGMASSIRTAINEISKNVSVNNAIILLCDQPFVSAELLNAMRAKQMETGQPIVACTYNGTTGVPALFDRTLFAELLLLQGQEGTKKMLKAHTHEVAIIPFEQGSIDIDTPDDYEQLLKLSD